MLQANKELYKLAKSASDLFTLVHTGTKKCGWAPTQIDLNKPNKVSKQGKKVNILPRQLTGAVIYYRPLNALRSCIVFLMWQWCNIHFWLAKNVADINIYRCILL